MTGPTAATWRAFGAAKMVGWKIRPFYPGGSLRARTWQKWWEKEDVSRLSEIGSKRSLFRGRSVVKLRGRYHDLWPCTKKSHQSWGSVTPNGANGTPKSQPFLMVGWRNKLWNMVGNHQTLKKLSGLRVQVREFLPPKCRNKFNLFGVGGWLTEMQNDRKVVPSPWATPGRYRWKDQKNSTKCGTNERSNWKLKTHTNCGDEWPNYVKDSWQVTHEDKRLGKRVELSCIPISI